MRKILLFAIVLCLVAASGFVWAAQQAKPTPTSWAGIPVDEVLQAVRADLQTSRADIIAKNITLSSEQAAKFWPVFEQYQKEQNAIMDEQMRGIQRFVDGYNSLDDAGALALINAHFDRDARMNALRQKWLIEFQKAIGTKMAVRAMQIDRRLSLAHQVEFAARIPLAH